MRYKLLALDMDGTLLGSDKRISDANREWIRQAADAGVRVCLTTGRGHREIEPYLNDLGLAEPFVAVNGGEVWQDARTLLSRHLLDVGLIRRLHELAQQYGLWYWAYAVSGIHNTDRWPDRIEDETWLKFCVHADDPDTLRAVADETDSWGCLELSNSGPNNLEFNPLGVTKASGLEEVCALVGCSMMEVAAVGDSLNDMPMIRQAGLGVAMGNAQEAVKQAADCIAPGNDEDGVAWVIQRYILAD